MFQNFPRFQHVSFGDRQNNKELAKATGVSETFWKQGKYMALAAGLVKEHLPSIPSNFDKKDADIVARMMKNMTFSWHWNWERNSQTWPQMRLDSTVLNNLPELFWGDFIIPTFPLKKTCLSLNLYLFQKVKLITEKFYPLTFASFLKIRTHDLLKRLDKNFEGGAFSIIC